MCVILKMTITGVTITSMETHTLDLLAVLTTEETT